MVVIREILMEGAIAFLNFFKGGPLKKDWETLIHSNTVNKLDYFKVYITNYNKTLTDTKELFIYQIIGVIC